MEKQTNHLADVQNGIAVNQTTPEQPVLKETSNSNTNHLANVHSGKEVAPFTEDGAKITNHYATENEDSKLGDVPDVLPTHLGGLELESEPNEENEATKKTLPTEEV